MMGAILPFPYYPHYNELNYEKKIAILLLIGVAVKWGKIIYFLILLTFTKIT